MKEEILLWVKKAKEQDPDAFTKLMNYYMKDMYRTAIAILLNDADAADAIQETILKCWEKMSSLKNDGYFKTWLTRCLINNCYDIRKINAKYYLLSENMTFDHAQYCFADDEYNLELKEALDALPEKYRLPLTLFYGEEYQIKEIAELLKIPKSTVQTRLSRGREKLVKYLQMEGKE